MIGAFLATVTAVKITKAKYQKQAEKAASAAQKAEDKAALHGHMAEAVINELKNSQDVSGKIQERNKKSDTEISKDLDNMFNPS